jgi:hypothetical protein
MQPLHVGEVLVSGSVADVGTMIAIPDECKPLVEAVTRLVGAAPGPRVTGPWSTDGSSGKSARRRRQSNRRRTRAFWPPLTWMPRGRDRRARPHPGVAVRGPVLHAGGRCRGGAVAVPDHAEQQGRGSDRRGRGRGGRRLPDTAAAMSHLLQQGTWHQAETTAQGLGRLPYSRSSFERVGHAVGAVYTAQKTSIDDALIVALEIPGGGALGERGVGSRVDSTGGTATAPGGSAAEDGAEAAGPACLPHGLLRDGHVSRRGRRGRANAAVRRGADDGSAGSV